MKRLLKASALIVVLGFTALSVAACSMQNRFIFYPDDTAASLPDGAVAEQITIGTDDGEELVAFYAKAEDNCPTIVSYHGNAQHLNHLAGITDLYGGNGVGFLSVAYRGYSGSTGKPDVPGIRSDGRAAYDYLIEQGISADSIVIRGFSLGSYVAISVASERDAKAVVLGAPFESGTRMGKDQIPYLPIGLFAGNIMRSDKLAPKVDEPVLIIHGADDTVISADHSADLAPNFPNLAQRIVVPGKDHNDLQDTEYELQVISFIAPFYPQCDALQGVTQ